AAPGPFVFLVLGDSGTGSAAQHELARRINAEEDVSLVLHVGDISQDDGSLDRLEAHYLAVYAPLMSRVPFFPALGNHDYGTDLAAPCLSVHVLPPSRVPPPDTGRYYSFDWGEAHFVSLDTNLLVQADATERMLAWLERDLGSTSRFWRIVYFHHPPYPSGHHLEDPISAKVRERLLPIFDRHRVQVVFSGHEHNYQRSKPLRDGAVVPAGRGSLYFISGGGGAHLYPVGSRPELAFGVEAHHYLRVEVGSWRMQVSAITAEGRVLDRIEIAPEPELAAGGVVNAGSFAPRLAPGSLISLFGVNLAPDQRRAAGLPLPAELAGTGVFWNQHALPLLFVSPHQINAQLPYGAEGRGIVRVRTPNGWAEAAAILEPAAPAIVRVAQGDALLPAVIRHGTGELVSAHSPALPGDTLIIYAIGLGAVNAPVNAGHAPPGPVTVLHRTEVQLGSQLLSPSFAGLTPGYPGLYQIHVETPRSLAPGAYPLKVITAGIASEAVTVIIGRQVLAGELEANAP
ncbi:MAG: metallophosphoesterase, partial [Bryobacterales bacterium]|nr:metallophosphoesterase [Bryobacteraceae bacterium]MDW8131123.1 metallophosphoesterase [Bryobacterales bacterium]